MTDIIQNAIETYGLQEIINSFNPKIADIMVDLFNIYEKIYGTEGDGSMFVTSAVQSLVLSHSGWSDFVGSTIDEATKKLVKDYISAKVYDIGAKINLERRKLE